ncbi:MAG: hypothetical protein WCS28_03530 [Thiomicrospira sp.]
MSDKKNNPVIYISGPGYSFKNFEPLIGSIDQHFQEILSKLCFRNSDGIEVDIDLQIDLFNHEKVRAYAKTLDKSKGTYKIKMTAGMSYNVWLVSRIFEVNYDIFPWLRNVKIRDKDDRKLGRKKLLADFAYFICSYAVLLHEISHVVLGHTDYLYDQYGCSKLNEFSDEDEKLSEDKKRVLNAFEADADRQSIEFLMAFMDSAMGEDGLGMHLRFPTQLAVHEFIIYSLTSLTVFLQQQSAGKRSVHPMPNERQYIYTSSIISYLEKTKPELVEVLRYHLPFIGMEAAKKMGLIDASDVSTVVSTALNLGHIDDVINKSKIRSFQHKPCS